MTFVRGGHRALRWEDCGRTRRWGWERVSSSVWGKCEIFSQRPGGESGHPRIHTWSSGEKRRLERESWGCQHVGGTSRGWARSPVEGVKLQSKRRQDWACPRPCTGDHEGAVVRAGPRAHGPEGHTWKVCGGHGVPSWLRCCCGQGRRGPGDACWVELCDPEDLHESSSSDTVKVEVRLARV